MKATSARFLILVLSLTLSILVTACGSSDVPNWDNMPPGTYPPHPVFEDFYLEHGGYDLFGYPISTVYTNQSGTRFQFFETVLMSYDPAAGSITFAPLGLELGLDALPITASRSNDDGLIIGEFNIHPAFVTLYLTLGPDRVGLPISHPYLNTSRNRMEQHFEGAGIFFLLDDPEQTPSLLDYSLVACQSCRPQSHPRQENAIVQTPLVNSSFYDQMAWANISIGLTGEVLRDPAQLVDGTTDLVFENMVVYNQDGALKIRPLPIILRLNDPYYYTPISHPDLVFYPIEGNTGHNVYRLFDTYIWENGGYTIAGAPISEIVPVNIDLGQFRQCFENLCLEYSPQNTGLEIRPMPLGRLYLETMSQMYVPDKESADSNKSPNQGVRHVNPFTLIVWEHPTVVDSQTPETISVKVIFENTPQPGLTISLKVTLPDGSEAIYEMPPTAEDGTTSYTLSPIQAENSELVFYQTCLEVQGENQLCVEQSFMIWGNP